jgi:hypothetical protein
VPRRWSYADWITVVSLTGVDLLTDEDIDVLRTPVELRAFVEEVGSQARGDQAEHDRGVLKRGPYKRLLDEVIPLSLYASVAYTDEFRLLPVKGNQAYDAEVFDATGEVVERIEVTLPHDGEWEAEDARRLVDRGYGKVRVWSAGEDIDEIRPFVMDTARKKALRDYGDATLLFVLNVVPLAVSHSHARREKLEALFADLARMSFSAGRVRVLVMPDTVEDIAQANKSVQPDAPRALLTD